MYYRLESKLNEIGVLLDTNTRDNCKRNPFFKDQYPLMEIATKYSELYNLPISKTFSAMRDKIVSHGQVSPFDPFDIYQINCIWEAIYEIMRPTEINIKRVDCAYFFTSEEDCNKYKSYPGMKDAVVCSVNIIEEYNSFLGDMMWLENLDEAIVTAKEIKEAASFFWKGQMTSNPMKEILFQGKYKLKKI